MPQDIFDSIVIGGGLGGMVAALTLARAGYKVVIIDKGLPEAEGELGGFTSFSGAKFSLLPAGQGLIPVAGNVERLQYAMREVLDLCGIEYHGLFEATVLPLKDSPLVAGAEIRSYKSIVLNPSEIGLLLRKISSFVYDKVEVLKTEVLQLERIGNRWAAMGIDGPIAFAETVVFAGGRVSGSLLRRAGAKPQEGKGLDVGVRLEFIDRNALRSLRERGPDAKILLGRTRTFCLNHPGRIYRYPFGEISIPGGVVEAEGHPSANFGLLTRLEGKAAALESVLAYLGKLSPSAYEHASVVRGAPFQDKAIMLESAYGAAALHQLQSLAEALGREGLVDWQSDHRVHFPLLDWHWDVFAAGCSHRTSLPNLYVAGDTAGHARGLLQAGVSGWLAAHELLDDANV